MSTHKESTAMIWADSFDKGRLFLHLHNGELSTSTSISVDAALKLAESIREEIARMPRVVVASDLGIGA